MADFAGLTWSASFDLRLSDSVWCVDALGLNHIEVALDHLAPLDSAERGGFGRALAGSGVRWSLYLTQKALDEAAPPLSGLPAPLFIILIDEQANLVTPLASRVVREWFTAGTSLLSADSVATIHFRPAITGPVRIERGSTRRAVRILLPRDLRNGAGSKTADLRDLVLQAGTIVEDAVPPSLITVVAETSDAFVSLVEAIHDCGLGLRTSSKWR